MSFARITVLFTLVLSLLPSTVLAGIIMVPILGIEILSEGSTTITRPSQDRIEVVTRGLQIEGTVACAGDAQCIDSGLDGAALRIDEDLRLEIDTTAVTVAGNATGHVYGSGTPVAFDAPISGSAACVGAAPDPCQALQLNIQILGGGQSIFYFPNLSWQLGDGIPMIVTAMHEIGHN